MSTTLTAATMTVTVTEAISLNGKDQGANGSGEEGKRKPWPRRCRAACPTGRCNSRGLAAAGEEGWPGRTCSP